MSENFLFNEGTFDGFHLVYLTLFMGSLTAIALWLATGIYLNLWKIAIFSPPKLPVLQLIRVVIIFVFRLHKDQTVYKNLEKFSGITMMIFFMVVLGNITGLLPFAFSYTGHIAFTFFLSLTIFLGWFLVGLRKLNVHFFALFIPHNCPKWLFPLMIVIEILSFAIRPFSLAIRLFANILSGHILLHLIQGTGEKIRDGEKNGSFSIIPPTVSIPVRIIEIGVYLLETGVALLQGYIFSILSCIYLYENVFERRFGHHE
jgi:ATP synthase subunit 6